MEVSFAKEARQLRLGHGDVFHGEGILAITKALLQSGVAYVGGYQGAPVSHLMDVLVQSKDYLAELGVHVEACSNEASAAAMLGASIHYPLRGAVTWKSIVGTNVAADALSNLASPGVTGGALIVIGEDYGEGASVIQERTLAFALKSSLILLDPRPELAHMVRMVESGFALSEASCTPVLLQLRIRACHVRGSFVCKDNVAPPVSERHRLGEPALFDYGRLSHPPSTFRHEKVKSDERLPAARRFIAEHSLNERIRGKRDDLGIIVQGGLHNSLIRALTELGLADDFGASVPSLYVLNVTCPLVPDEVRAFCEGKRAVLVVEEGQPDFIEQEIAAILRRHDVAAPLHGKDLLPMAGEYTVEVIAPAQPHSSRAMRRSCRSRPGARGSMRSRRGAKPSPATSRRRCRRGRRSSASAARSGRCSPRSSSCSRTSAGCTSPPTSAAIRSRRSSRSTRDTRS